jgi:hypothetical protein
MMDGHGRLVGLASAGACTLLLAGSLAAVQAPAGDGPFVDDLVGKSVSFFDMTKEVTFRGVVTMPLTAVRDPRGAHCFRIEVRDETGGRTIWAVLVRKASGTAELKLGASIDVTGRTARDGTKRLESWPEKIRPVSP